jgi:predicted transcriptional regulator of viral defense system
MKTSLLLKKLRLENKEFVTSEELKRYCKQLQLDYESTIDHFLTRGHFIRIFRGVFYVKSLDEMKLGKTKYSYLELVAKGLEIKGVKNWYFGLYTALKLNNMTHEYFSIDYVVNDKMLRINPMKVSGHKFRFMKLKSSLLSFGAITKDGLSYSDPEKTILDFIYIWRYNGIPRDRIIADVGDWSINLSVSRLIEYTKNYPKTVQEITLEIAHNRKVLT